MAYTFIASLSALVLILINIDLFLPNKASVFPAAKEYRWFLFGVLVFHVADLLWGVFYANKLPLALSIDTNLFFLFQALSVLLWARYVFRYLADDDVVHRIIFGLGVAFFLFQVGALIANFFTPVLFSVDLETNYVPGMLRYVALGVQIFMFFAISVYALVMAIRSKGAKRARHSAVVAFGVFMAAAVVLQIYDPLMPYYSIGYLLGICALHTFVVNYERRAAELELNQTKTLVFTDPLTGVQSKHAYVDVEAAVDEKIVNHAQEPFAVMVFDLNDLKKTNDEKGHGAGDDYIIESVRLICRTLRDSPVYRVGGDEFVSILTVKEYDLRYDLRKEFDGHVDANLAHGGAVVSSGLSDYNPDEDQTLRQVFVRADTLMYSRKRELKKRAS
ncbi:MAG: GGDEF domain-containing protein [Bacilli bacterium]|nr:GGDEF domain-containing protein [Bacilli bacterium]